jgi:hypothetical protein
MSDSHTIALDVSSETHAFIKAAAGSRSVADFVRQAARSAASAALGKEAPHEAVKPRGKSSPFSQKAKEAGMSVDQYIKKLACDAAGVPYVPPVKREKIPYVGDAKPEGAEVTAPTAEAPKVEQPKATPARPQAGLRRPAAK